MSTYLVLVGTHAEVLDGLTGVLGTAEQQGVAAGRGTESQLVEGQSFATGGDNAGAGSSGESESSDGDLRNLQETVVIGDSTNDDDGLSLGVLVDLTLDTREGDGRSVDAGHEEAAQDNLVEAGIRSAYATGIGSVSL